MAYREVFNEFGYALLKNIASPEIVNIVSDYALIREAKAFVEDTQQVVGAHAVYADHLMESLLLHYKPIIEHELEMKLLPTYSFYRVYRRGHELVPHTDRPSCEISLSVCYNFDYKGKDYSWDLVMDGTPLKMSPGDGAVYRGIDIPHWREPFNVPQDSYHIQAFYHYVDANGKYAEYAYDQKKPSHLQMIESLR